MGKFEEKLREFESHIRERYMHDPDFKTQIAEKDLPVDSNSRAWAQIVADEMRAEGATWIRFSYQPDYKLYLVEGWKARPEVEPAVAFMLIAA